MSSTSFRNWVLVVAIAIAGCGGDDDPANDLSAGPADMAAHVDFSSSIYAGIHCADMNCPASQVCCVRPVGVSFTQACETSAACSAGGAAAVCDGPEDCPSATAECCASVTFEQTSSSTAVPKGGASSCVAACQATVTAASGSINFDSKLCHLPSDCTGYTGQIYGSDVAFDGCCYRPEIGLRFCAPKDVSYRNIGGYYCLDTQ